MKRSLKNFDIQHVKLKDGIHHFDFICDEGSFALRENNLVQKGYFDIKITLEKQQRVFRVKADFSGHLIVTCDRCGDDIKKTYNFEESIIYKLVHELKESTDEIIFVQDNLSEINIYDFLIDSICLQLIYRKTCDMIEKKCNPIIEKMLNQNFSEEKEIDPRWEELKKLMDNK